MKIGQLFISLLIVFATAALLAAKAASEPQSKNPAEDIAITVKESAEPVIPKRELKFDVTEQDEPLALEKVQEGMLDQRYVATFRLVFPKKEMTEQTSKTGTPGPRSSSMDNELKINIIGRIDEQLMGAVFTGEIVNILGMDRQIWKRFRLFNQDQHRFLNGPMEFHKSPGGFYKDLSEMAPEKHRLPKAVFNTANEQKVPLIEYKYFGDARTGNASIQIRLLATTADEAKKWVEAWLAIYDWGLCYPAQKECLLVKNKLKERIMENSEKLPNAEKEYDEVKKELEKYKDFQDIKADAISNLTTQRRLLSVDLAGIKARISACEEMLAQKNISTARKDQIETAMVAAQIELRGLDAKQEEIDRIIKGAQKRQELLSSRGSLNSSIYEYKSNINAISKAIEKIEESQLGYYPVPVKDGKVTISPIKWVSPANKPQSDKP